MVPQSLARYPKINERGSKRAALKEEISSMRFCAVILPADLRQGDRGERLYGSRRRLDERLAGEGLWIQPRAGIYHGAPMIDCRGNYLDHRLLECWRRAAG